MRYKEITSLMENPEREDMNREEVEGDRLDQARLDDTRKPHLTLRVLNHLKKSRINKKKELEDQEKILGIMYASPNVEEDV